MLRTKLIYEDYNCYHEQGKVTKNITKKVEVIRHSQVYFSSSNVSNDTTVIVEWKVYILFHNYYQMEANKTT